MGYPHAGIVHTKALISHCQVRSLQDSCRLLDFYKPPAEVSAAAGTAKGPRVAAAAARPAAVAALRRLQVLCAAPAQVRCLSKRSALQVSWYR